ncbi:CDP-diacylglycerol--glycerol-3-phosphate 3-phosphatidyltransferase [Anaerotruncus rubiinfantis]|uniref:CDP-diacylglycerol--glycerol-3-phosphate 3-phosphatidyltransferase n=1 Tax=Anaerotruncus rubiinfantis TaxID=1720200 RepID=UPI0011CB6FAB|nr:CDP-diacylglycerol--glycerol-3-phosphate 3-phosphatidyltransferase [Anaerotruncus rubiinfantis]
MNLPNKLTVLRMALIPVFLIFMFADTIPWRYLWAAAVFGAASFTDYLDGNIARRDGLVTNFGKLMDPLADKLLVFSALICFIPLGRASALGVFVILARELLVTSVRLIAAEHGAVIAADKLGKLKTVFQIIWVLYTLFAMWVTWDILPPSPHSYSVQFFIGDVVLQLVVVVLTLLSGWNYIWKNRGLFDDIR